MPKKAGNQLRYFEFALWAMSIERMPTIKEVEGFFQIRRENAWRTHRNWMRALQNHRETTSPAATGTTANPIQRTIYDP